MNVERETNVGRRGSSCPYAVRIEEDERSESSGTVEDIVSQAKKSCPAFKEGQQCPFSNAKTAEDIRQTLVKVPQSHLKEAYFRKTLEQVHVVSPSVTEKQYQLPGGCPAQTFINKDKSFALAMEDLSLAAIMSRMAQSLEEDCSSDDETENTIQDQLNEVAVPDLPHINSKKENVPHAALSEAFKTGTAVAHKAAEDVHFVNNFIRGKIDRGLYADLVMSLYKVYDVLEHELDQHAPQHFHTCHFPKELNRKEALKEDIDFWHGRAPMYTTAATQDYINRIRQIAKENPLLLLSHAYTRYLGDLSGGKILARVARKSLNLSRDGDGLAFYDFPHIQSPKLFKDHYRRSLDELKLDQEQILQLVAEANVAFILNMRIFEELDVKANVPGAKVRSLESAMELATAKPSNQGAMDECPFLKKKNAAKSNNVETKKRCPWPFIFAHDPITGLKEYQTWVFIALLVSWLWSRAQG